VKEVIKLVSPQIRFTQREAFAYFYTYRLKLLAIITKLRLKVNDEGIITIMDSIEAC
jgi:hypothetical protein